MSIANAKNGEIRRGDMVVATNDDDYAAYLVGVVTDIKPLGSPDRETENETDDVYVNFMDSEYSDKRLKEIEKHFTEVYGEHRPFNELPLDMVIMSPESLIRITDMEPKDLGYLLHSEELVKAYIDYITSGSRSTAEFSTLKERLDANLADYQAQLMKMTKEELIKNAGDIAAMNETHGYLVDFHDFDNDELAFFLHFQNPLAIVKEVWHDRNGGLHDFRDMMGYIGECRDEFLQQYPLMCDTAEQSGIPEETQEKAETANRQKPKPQSKTAGEKKSVEDMLRAAQKKVNAQPANAQGQRDNKRNNTAID